MRFELFMARRYLFAQSGMKFISVTTWISVAGVALGVAALIVVMGVMNGFTVDLRDKIIGVTSHMILFNGTSPATDSPAFLDTVRSVPDVVAATPFIYSELMLSSSAGAKGVLLRGIDPVTAPSVLTVLTKMTEGSVEALSEPGPLPGIIIGQDLAKRLSLSIGSRVNLMSPTGQQTSAGFAPQIKAFRVVGIFYLGMFEYDSSCAFVSLDGAREVLGWPPDVVSGIELTVKDIFRAEEIADSVIAKVGPPYYAQTWMTMNANLFAALKLEKAAMAVILFLVVVVGAFSIITALVMIVMEKTRDIAILMSMGATRQQIRSIFIHQGLLIGTMGALLGYALGLGICFILKNYQFIELPRGVYSLDYLPVLLEWKDLALTGLCAVGICFLATLYPAAKAASLEPVEALRYE